jgi:hypothetical protein
MPDIAFNPSGLFAAGERLPAIKAWLTETVWSPDRYLRLDPEQFLHTGETEVCRLEELVSTGAPQVWDELQADSQRAPTIKSWLGLDAPLPLNEQRAALVFDGLSLRELPLLLQLAESSDLRVKSVGVVATSLPTETNSFVEQRVLGTYLAPSALHDRTELAQKNTKAFYFEHPNSRYTLPANKNLLLWSTYPDRLFADDNART